MEEARDWERLFIGEIKAGRDPRRVPSRSVHVSTDIADVSTFLDGYLERYVKPAGLRSIDAVCSRIGILKQHLGHLPLSALEEPDDINQFKTDSDYAEDVELATIHRVLETLRAAINWGMAQTPPLFAKTPLDSSSNLGGRTPFQEHCRRPTRAWPLSRSPGNRCALLGRKIKNMKVGQPATPRVRHNMRVPVRLEIAVSITAYIAGIVGVGLGARLILEAVGPHPAVAQAVYWTIVPAAGIGGLIAFWFLSSRVEFLWRGYQVGFRQGRAYYEERDASGERRGLAFDWFPLTEGYRPRGLVRLSPLGTWELEAPVWARGRRDDIAGRITKDLSSYEGWPALLMPDAPTVDSPADTNPTSTLIRAIVDRWPEWAPYVVSGAEGGRVDRVLLSVPPPEHASHRLEVACSGDAFEIAYECGQPGLRAAATFGLADRAAALSCVCEFLRELRDGEMVVLVRRLPLLTRRRRVDRARYSAQFLSVSGSIRDSRWCVYEWHTDRNQNAG